MLIVRDVSTSVVPYFTDGRDCGAWTPGATRLLGLAGPVEPPHLRAVLDGRHPDSGRFLPGVRARRRRGGWDLVFAAPKSVSLLAGSTEGDSVAAAHGAAVREVIDYLDRRLTVVRTAEPGGTAPAGGLIGAHFEHRANAAAEPHLHTHVLVANLTRTEVGWSAVRNEGWFTGRRSLAALYQLALRAELRSRGWQLEWRLRPDGLADVADVPSAAVRATSTQSRLAVANGRYEARRQAVAGPWRERASRAGWEGPPISVVSPPVAGSGGPGTGSGGPGTGSGNDARLDDPELTARVTARLAARRSDFSVTDAIVALGASHAPGALPEEAADWAERFCQASVAVPSPTAGRRWTTTLARSADDRLLAALHDLHTARSPARAGIAVSDPSAPGRAPVRGRLWEGVAPPAGGIVVLGSPAGRSALLAQAELLQHWRHQWPAESVAVHCPSALGAARWAALCGIPAHRRGHRVAILVVDQADRRSTPELLSLAAEARRSGTGLVLVEGGTLPRVTNFASHGLAQFAQYAQRVACLPPAPWTAVGPPVPVRHLDPGLSGRTAATALLRLWAADPDATLLVGLGLEEVRALNLAARLLVGGGPTAVDADCTRRSPDFRAGDRVVVIRARDGLPAYGTFGEVSGVGPGGSPLSVRWVGEDRARTHAAEALTGVGHGWAVTAHMAARLGRPVMVLGAAEAVPRLRGLVRAEIEPPGRGRSLLLER